MSKHVHNLRLEASAIRVQIAQAHILAAADHLERVEKQLRAERKRNKIARAAITNALKWAERPMLGLALDEMKAVK